MDWPSIIIRLIAAVLTVSAFILIFYLFNRIASAQQKRSKTLYVCPKCFATNYTYLKHLPSETPFVGSLRSHDYFKCNACSFEGMFPLVKEEELPSLRKDLLHKSSKKKSSSKNVNKSVLKKSSRKKKN